MSERIAAGGMDLAVATDPEALEVVADIVEELDGVGLQAAFLVRDLDSGAELGHDPDRAIALASVLKMVQALVICDRFASGELDPSTQISVDPATATPGPTGLARFDHPATVAVADLLKLSMAISDNAASDTLFDLVGPSQVTDQLRRWHCDGLWLRHPIRELFEAVASFADDDMTMALELATAGATRGGGHLMSVLDSSRGNCGTARGLVDFLHRVWTDQVSVPAATSAVRGLMSGQVNGARMQAELASDGNRWLSKTGSFLNLRHEAGVLETSAGQRIAVAFLTESRVRAHIQPAAEYAIGAAARMACDLLMDRAVLE